MSARVNDDDDDEGIELCGLYTLYKCESKHVEMVS